MLAEIKRKEELKRVNEKFGKQGSNNRNETILQKTTNLMDEEELLLLIDREDRAANKANKNRDSECLNSLNLLSGGLKDMKVDQKELDSDEMREEMKDDESEDNPHMVQMGWKISDEPSQQPTTEVSTPAKQYDDESNKDQKYVDSEEEESKE